MPTIDSISGINHYPPRCTREKFGNICGATLVKERVSDGLSVPSPLRPFAYHHFNDHIASMLSQPGIESAIHAHMHNGALDRELHEIISSPNLTQSQDSMGLPFLRDCGTEIRLVWAICVDWYNPRTNKASGKSVSTGTGVISMICLSLPPHLWVCEELIYDAGTMTAGTSCRCNQRISSPSYQRHAHQQKCQIRAWPFGTSKLRQSCKAKRDPARLAVELPSYWQNCKILPVWYVVCISMTIWRVD